MDNLTIFIPISRDLILERLFASLEVLKCNRHTTSLFTYVDNADPQLFVKIRNLTEQSKFAKRLCIQRADGSKTPKFSIKERRLRIADIKNESREYIKDKWVFCIEDDTIVPANALRRLKEVYTRYPYAGFVQGVEMGRWGNPYWGAWEVDEIYDPTKIVSKAMPVDTPVEPIDAGGFYCYLTRNYDQFYEPFGNNDLGPDIEFGLKLRQAGHENYVDWSVKCDHYDSKSLVVNQRTYEPSQVSFTKVRRHWLEHNIKQGKKIR